MPYMPHDITQYIINCAEAHGTESEPEHEAMDLRHAVAAAGHIMTPAQHDQWLAELRGYGMWEEDLP